MSDSYVTAKIREALKAANGDVRDAEKLIISWAVRDQPLLLGLAKPHLKALAMARIDDVNRRSGEYASTTDDAVEAIILEQTQREKRHPSMVPPPKSYKKKSLFSCLCSLFGSKK